MRAPGAAAHEPLVWVGFGLTLVLETKLEKRNVSGESTGCRLWLFDTQVSIEYER